VQRDMLVLFMINAGSLSIPCLRDPVTRELHEHEVSRLSFPVIAAAVAETDQCANDSRSHEIMACTGTGVRRDWASKQPRVNAASDSSALIGALTEQPSRLLLCHALSSPGPCSHVHG
jgi:hypothetical protein